MTRISTTDQRVIDAFFTKYESYDFVVTVDEFDEFDDWGPGRYSGCHVPEDEAEAWDQGLIRCRELGLHGRSQEGMMIRWQVLHPDADRLPPALQEVVDERIARLRQQAEAEAAERARLTLLESLEQGVRIDLRGLPAIPEVDRVMQMISDRGVPVATYRWGSGDEYLWIDWTAIDDMDEVAQDDRYYGHVIRYYRLDPTTILRGSSRGGAVIYTSDVAFAREALQACIDILEQQSDQYYSQKADQARAILSSI